MFWKMRKGRRQSSSLSPNFCVARPRRLKYEYHFSSLELISTFIVSGNGKIFSNGQRKIIFHEIDFLWKKLNIHLCEVFQRLYLTDFLNIMHWKLLKNHEHVSDFSIKMIEVRKLCGMFQGVEMEVPCCVLQGLLALLVKSYHDRSFSMGGCRICFWTQRCPIFIINWKCTVHFHEESGTFD